MKRASSIDALSMRLAIGIKSIVPNHPSSVEVLKYSLAFILNGLFIVFFTMAVSMLTGKYEEAAVALLSFALLRAVSGGIHLESGVLCIVLTTILMTVLSFISFDSNVTVVLFTLISLLIAIIYAPSRMHKQTRFPKKYYPHLRIVSAVVVAANLIITSDVLAATFLVQTLTLIRIRR